MTASGECQPGSLSPMLCDHDVFEQVIDHRDTWFLVLAVCHLWSCLACCFVNQTGYAGGIAHGRVFARVNIVLENVKCMHSQAHCCQASSLSGCVWQHPCDDVGRAWSGLWGSIFLAK